jgi:hypothetical protein
MAVSVPWVFTIDIGAAGMSVVWTDFPACASFVCSVGSLMGGFWGLHKKLVWYLRVHVLQRYLDRHCVVSKAIKTQVCLFNNCQSFFWISHYFATKWGMCTLTICTVWGLVTLISFLSIVAPPLAEPAWRLVGPVSGLGRSSEANVACVHWQSFVVGQNAQLGGQLNVCSWHLW